MDSYNCATDQICICSIEPPSLIIPLLIEVTTEITSEATTDRTSMASTEFTTGTYVLFDVTEIRLLV